MNMRILFHLDGSGIYYDPFEPLHLDGILGWDLAPRQGLPMPPLIDRAPTDVDLPLLRQAINGEWVWRASALFPLGPRGEDLQFLRKRFRAHRADLADGSPNLTNGAYMARNLPLPLLLCRTMVAYASGSRRGVRKILKRIRYLGKKRSVGLGKVLAVEIEEIDEDLSLVYDGRAQRYLPHPLGPRKVRPRPPYWHPIGRCRCWNVGDHLPDPAHNTGEAIDWLACATDLC